MRDVKIGAPGYILLGEIQKDLRGTLRRLGEIGYDGFEITGFFGHPAQEIRSACEDAGLIPYGCFANLTTLCGEKQESEGGNWSDFARAFEIKGDTPDEVVQYIKDIGCEYVGMLIPNAPMTPEVIAKINFASEVVRRHGMKLQYHNHDYEYNNMTNGQYRMDYILENTSKDVLFEPDLGWMEIAGYPSEKALRRHAERIEIVHLKDYYRAGSDPASEFIFRPTGYGVMDWARVIPLCEELIKPRWYTADHDKAYDGDIYEELEMSLRFIKGMLRYC